MGLPWKQFIVIAGSSVLCVCALGQDSQSLGDAARQARQQKQSKGSQSKSAANAAPTSAAPTSKVITNDDIASSSGAAGDASAGGKNHGSAGSAQSSSSSSSESSSGQKMSGEAWKSQIRGQKDAVKAMQANLDKLNDSIHFTTGNCVSGCAQWNERQQQKQQEVERMRAQLEQQKKQLHDMQESARQQGYGSSVYDP